MSILEKNYYINPNISFVIKHSVNFLLIFLKDQENVSNVHLIF